MKIISKETNIEAVRQEAQTLEAESGGILVAVERVNKGYAIIVYRGKNYERPASLRPHTLLTKREAMKRSLEAQRRKVKLACPTEFTHLSTRFNSQLLPELRNSKTKKEIVWGTNTPYSCRKCTQFMVDCSTRKCRKSRLPAKP